MTSCPFCSETQIQLQRLHEKKFCFVLYNIRPKTRGHCLVIPKRHVTNVRDLTNNERTEIINTVAEVSFVLKKYLQPDGFNYGFNEGNLAGQTVEHFHYHVLPRFPNDDVPEFHVFHRDPAKKRNLTGLEMQPLVDEFSTLF